MAELALVLLGVVGTYFVIKLYERQSVSDVTSPKQTQNLTNLWNYFNTAMKRQRLDAAERALLKILKYDHKNTSAYNQLGMIYVRKNQPEDAIACFDIASSLAPSVASLYNLGLVHFQNGNYQEAALALERVVDIEPTPKRLLVFAKVLQNLENYKKVVDVVKRAVELDPSESNLLYLAESYEAAKQYKKAEEVRQQIAQMQKDEPSHFNPEKMQT